MPRNRKGLLHIIDAAGFSIGGFRRLWGETAARLEIIIGAALGLILWALGLPAMQIAIYAMLLLALLVVEAINTAIEELVDHLASDWALWAKHAKDLGSFAVGGMILIIAIYLTMVLLPILG